MENALWGQKRIQAKLARLEFKVSARIVAMYMRARHHRGAKPRLARVPKAPRTGHLDLRLFLCPNGRLPNVATDYNM
jgi:hypothetical protein